MKNQLENFCLEVNENLDNNEKMRFEIEDILETHYDGLYEFFLSIIEGDYTYVIIMSRRCLVLYQIFMIFYILDNRIVESKCVVLSDKAVPYYYNKIRQEDKIIIVDDIIVHGRTVSKLYDFLKMQCLNLEIKVYMASRTRNCVSKKIGDRIWFKFEASEHEWRKLSNKFVDCIVESNVPYTSFVPSFFQYNSANVWNYLETQFSDSNELKYYIYKGNSSNNCESERRYYFEKNSRNFPIFESLSLGECIRLYWNPKIEKLTVIPYVFLRALKFSEIDIVTNTLKELIPQNCININSILQKEAEGQLKSSLYEYKMRLLTCILSDLYWKVFEERYLANIKIEKYFDNDTIEKSFGKEISNELIYIEENYQTLLSVNLQIQNKYCSEDSMLTILKKNINASKCDIAIRNHFKCAWSEDETEARNNRERKEGFLVEDFIKVCTKWEKNEILANLISNWDIGIAAANFKVKSESKLVGCFITSGEQSYKILLERNPEIMVVLLIISNQITRGEAKEKGEPYNKYRVKILKEVLSKLIKRYPSDDLKTITQLIEETEGYMNAWNQWDILPEKDYMEDPNIQKILEKYCEG